MLKPATERHGRYKMKRREFIQASAGLTASAVTAPFLSACATPPKSALKGNIHHSVARWTMGDLPLNELLPKLASIGLSAIDLIGPEEFHILHKHQFDCSMCNGAEISLTEGWSNKQFHNQLIKNYTETIPKVAEAGFKNLICFSGNRVGMTDEEGIQNAVDGLSQVIQFAEQHQVILQMELFNSKVDHPDYFCDRSSHGIEIAKRLKSEHFKLLYDIYHMQISEGDIIRTIQNNHQYFGHYHTAGVPGRHEIDTSQELNYPAIMQAILGTGFAGYVAQEFIPTDENKLDALEKAIRICDI